MAVVKLIGGEFDGQEWDVEIPENGLLCAYKSCNGDRVGVKLLYKQASENVYEFVRNVTGWSAERIIKTWLA